MYQTLNMTIHKSLEVAPLRVIRNIFVAYSSHRSYNIKLVFNLSVENTFIVFGRDIWLLLQTCQISLRKTNWHVLYRQIEHLFVLVIVFYQRGGDILYLQTFAKNLLPVEKYLWLTKYSIRSQDILSKIHIKNVLNRLWKRLHWCK